MKPRWVGVAAVVSIAIAIVAYKRTSRPEAMEVEPPAAASTASDIRAVGSVVLVANLFEADEPCMCGKIIRAVRSAAAKGVATKEIDPEEKPDQAASYRVRVSPAVLFLDQNGNELRRFEGESADTFAKIQADLDRLSAKHP